MKINKSSAKMLAAVFAFAFAFLAPLEAATVEAAKIYHIKALSAAGGDITDEGTSSVRGGKNKTYYIYPDKGHVVNYVTIDGENIGAVTEYTFENINSDHDIRAYFITEGARNASKAVKDLSVVGSYSLKNGSGKYKPNDKVEVDAGIMPGFTFAGWLGSDGKVYPSAQSVITMPDYDLILYANWMAEGTSGGLYQIATTNLKTEQIYGWAAIAQKLATFTPKDTADGKDIAMRVDVTSYNCYIDPASIAVLNARQGIALTVSYGADVSFTFLSDINNLMFAGTELSYTSTTRSSGISHEKKITFAEPGIIGTNVFANVFLPEAAPGQLAYVYITDAAGNDAFYMTAEVDASNRIIVPMMVKVDLKFVY